MMDDKNSPSDEAHQETKLPPARPPPPSKVKSAHSVDSQDEKIPPKRPNLPHQSSLGGAGIPASLQKHLDELRALQKHRVRWFYKEGKKWLPFNGRDSLVIEEEWQAFQNGSVDSDIEKGYGPTVRGRLFEVDVKERMCHPLYWKGSILFSLLIHNHLMQYFSCISFGEFNLRKS